MAIYEAWVDATGITLAPKPAIGGLITDGIISAPARCIYSFEAATAEEASAIHHIRQGWEPYSPSGEAEQCVVCESYYYPKGSGECWKCLAPGN